MPLSKPDLIRPTESQAEEARECLELLGESQLGEVVSVKLENGVELAVPAFAFRFVIQVLEEMAQGNAVTLLPIHSELTTQQAADILNVSRPYIVKLLERGEIPHHKRGRHRRIRFDDLMNYKKLDDERRGQALGEMVKLSEELGFGYE